MLPALDLLSNQEAELGRQSQELAARLDKVETYLCSEEFRRPWVNLQNQGEQGKRVDAALQGLTQIASLHDGEIGNIRAHLQQAEAQEQQWKSGFEAELQLGLEKRFDEARSTSELRLAGFSVLLEALPPRIRLCEDHVMALEKNQNDLAKRTEDIQSKLGQPTEEIKALMAQVRTMSGYTEAISQRDETIALLKGQIEAQQSELRQVQSRLAELQQLVQNLPPAQTMAGWNEGLNQRLLQFESAILAHEGTLSRQSQNAALFDTLQARLADSLNSQGAVRNEVDLLRADHHRTMESLNILKNKFETATLCAPHQGGGTSQC